jgi:hypothetical protein
MVHGLWCGRLATKVGMPFLCGLGVEAGISISVASAAISVSCSARGSGGWPDIKYIEWVEGLVEWGYLNTDQGRACVVFGRISGARYFCGAPLLEGFRKRKLLTW